MDTYFYEVNINWTSDKSGILHSPDINTRLDGNGCIEVATSPRFKNDIPGRWSPEHLFTAAVSSCLMSTFLGIAEQSNLAFTEFKCLATGKQEKLSEYYLMTEVILEPTVTIVNEEDRDKALKLLVRAESECLISRSINSKVRMLPVVRSLVPAEAMQL